jgi:hypothetical protein
MRRADYIRFTSRDAETRHLSTPPGPLPSGLIVNTGCGGDRLSALAEAIGGARRGAGLTF